MSRGTYSLMPFHDCWNLHFGSKSVVYEVRAVAYFNRPVCDVLNNAYQDKWVAKTGPVAWPSWLPKINPTYF
jgi:hypothetical protein